jgi:alkylation response protein AidB-like acyl-CoA dehydrogenase
MAQWCIVAARTAVKAVKHEGITMFLVPMESPGITVRPIPNLLGPHHLNELFLDDVSVGPDDVLGQVDEGWSVIREALKFERIGIARYARCDRLLTLVRQALGERWGDVPEALRARWTRARVHTRAAMVLAYRVVDAQAKGIVNDADASVARVAATLCDQEVAEVLLEALAAQAVDDGHTRHPVLHGAVEDHWRYAQAATVASGTIEIQRMLVARAALAGETR